MPRGAARKTPAVGYTKRDRHIHGHTRTHTQVNWWWWGAVVLMASSRARKREEANRAFHDRTGEMDGWMDATRATHRMKVAGDRL